MIALLTTARISPLRLALLGLAFSLGLGLTSCGKPAEIEYAKLKYSDSGLFLDPATQKPFTGIAREHYPNGQASKEYPMKNGQLHGLVKEWYKNGQASASTEFQNGERTGQNTEWKESGALYMQRVYDHDHIVSEKKY